MQFVFNPGNHRMASIKAGLLRVKIFLRGSTALR